MGSLNSSVLMGAQRSVRWLVLPITLLLVSGCSSIGGSEKGFSLKDLSFKNFKAPWSDREPAYEKIASNLVNSLIQVPQLNPASKAVHVPESAREFDVQLKAAFVRSGFDINPVSDNADVLLVSSEIKKTVTAAGRHRVFGVTMGDVSIVRAYAVVRGATVPVTSQLIMGTEAQAIDVNDDIFGSPDRSLASVEFQTPGAEENVRVMPVSIEKAEPKLLAANSNDARKQNYFDLGQSNYGGVFDEYENVVRSVLIFPNDSLRLGAANKAVIEQYVSQMDPDTDVLSVIGCSLGPTKIQNGNSLLAIGRANRVKEAFLFSGLDHDQVLEEGCWSSETAEMALPTRGVVVTLMRQKKL
ncbi:hypothetical protein N9850_12460 [Granulosicoccus sp.]|nr:hypothetical protein [Granulosicoccus sp.]MDB4224576.1 hypothetical protein [Granulosicoccus sp.]